MSISSSSLHITASDSSEWADHQPRSRFLVIKRAIDLAGSVIALLFFGVLLPIIAAGIYFSAPGPVFFRQFRTGLYGKPFVCYKFRTMYVHKHDLNATIVVTQKGDSRIFWFGKLLRFSNLDELPQLWNVVRGEMSLVGPRPLPVEEHRYWEDHIPDFKHRTLMKPGITGLAQANGLRGGTLELNRMLLRLEKDLEYLQNASAWMDIKIIGLTLWAMSTGRTRAH